MLRLAADALDEVQPEFALETEELKHLKDEAEELLKEAVDASVSPLMKAIVIESLERIVTAIKDYDVSGASGLKSALSESYGRVVVDKEIVLPEREKAWVKKYWEYLSRFTTAVNATEIAAQIGTNIVKLIDNL